MKTLIFITLLYCLIVGAIDLNVDLDISINDYNTDDNKTNCTCFLSCTDPILNPNLLQSVWFIDPVNGNDTRNGTTSASALKTYRELLNRWGCQEPILFQSTNITFLNDQPDFTDPVIFLGHILNGQVTFVGQLTNVGNGSFSSVIPKDRPVGQRWEITDGSIDWTSFIGYFLNDITADAWFWIDSQISSGTAMITQPMERASQVNANPAEVDSLAAHDNYAIYKPTKVYIVNFSPIADSGTASFMQNIWIIVPTPNQDISFTNQFTAYLEVRCDGLLSATGNQGNTFTNNWMGGGAIMLSAEVFGGSVGNVFESAGSTGSFILLDGDFSVNSFFHGWSGLIVVGVAYVAGDIDVPNINSLGASQMQLYITKNAYYGIAALWGYGALNVK